MSSRTRNVDTVYVAASRHDSRFTRSCVASVRYFYPRVPIRLLAGNRLPRGLTDELRHYWDVELEAIPAGDYGWGFVKLEALFGRPGERFLMLDSDTVLVGPVLDVWTGDSDFLVDAETQREPDAKRLYYDWTRVGEIDPRAGPPGFVFNSGQWFGTAGVLTRQDFAPWVEWSMPRRLRHPDRFMPGDQGILNYVLNQKAALGQLRVERRTIMRWPGTSIHGLDAKSLAERTAPPVVVHWAGMKTPLWQNMVGADLLAFFETRYFQRLPAGRVARLRATSYHVALQVKEYLRVRVALGLSRRIARLRRRDQ